MFLSYSYFLFSSVVIPCVTPVEIIAKIQLWKRVLYHSHQSQNKSKHPSSLSDSVHTMLQVNSLVLNPATFVFISYFDFMIDHRKPLVAVGLIPSWISWNTINPYWRAKKYSIKYVCKEATYSYNGDKKNCRRLKK